MGQSSNVRFQLGDFWLALRGTAWCIAWFDKATRQTRRLSTGLRDFEEAKRRLAEHVLSHATPDSAEAEDVPVKYVLDRYYEDHAKALPSGAYARYALGYWQAAFASDTCGVLTPARLESFAAGLLATVTLSPGTCNRILAVGRAALHRAHRRGVLSRLVFVPTVKAPQPKMKRATQAEIAALLNATDADLGHVRTWLLLAIGTLARPEALLQLERSQVDFDLGRIDLNQPGRIQSRKVRPTVPMGATVAGLVQNLPEGLLVRYRGEGLGDIRMGFERARKRAGLAQGITPYTIRRTMASELRRRGVPPWEIAGFLGHSARDYATTEVYAEYAPDYLGAASAAIEAYFAELAPLLDFELPHADWSGTKGAGVEGHNSRSAPVRATSVPTRVPAFPQVPDFMVGATGIEPATTTMSRSNVGSGIKDLRIIYGNLGTIEYKDFPASACHLRVNVRATPKETKS